MKANSKRSIARIMYVVLLMAILCCILVYLDMINYFSLQNIVSMILGFLIMIFVQLRFISYYFQNKMRELDIDEVGVIKDFIKNKIFGEINLNYIAKKQKIKYYQHTKDLNDKLFAEQNQQTYDCVMSSLRAKNSVQNINRVKYIRQKWEIFLAKITQFQVFLNNLHKLYKERSVPYKKFHQKTNILKDEDYQNWVVLFSRRQQYAFLQQRNEYCRCLQELDQSDWVELKKIIYDKNYFLQSKIKQISGQLITQFNAYANQMRAQLRQLITDLQNSQTEIANSKKTYRQILDRISSTKDKIETLAKKLKQKPKQNDNMEAMFNIECDMKFLQVELDNLQVRKTYTNDMKQKSIQNQYQLCGKKEAHLQNSGLKKFNNKISNYIMAYFDKFKLPFQKPKQKKKIINHQQILSMKNIFGGNTKFAYDRLAQVQRRQNQFKAYIADLLLLYEQEVRNLRKINDSIRDYEKQWKNNSLLKASHDSFITQRSLDTMFLDLIQSVNKKQIEIFSKSIHILREMQSLIQKKQQKKQQVLKSTLHYKNETINGPRSNNVNISIRQSENYLHQIYNFELQNKFPSCFKDICLCYVEGYSSIIKQVEEKKQLVDLKIKDNGQEDPRIIKMNEYKDQIYKFQNAIEQQGTNQNQRQIDENSLLFVNRLLDVFLKQWKNSDFFHEILKQEIEISLNAKRPPILSYMTLKYIKIHEKQPKSIQCLNILSDSIFICSFQAAINFKGKLALHIETEIKGKKIPIHIKLLVTQFVCPLKICFTPFTLGKSYFSMMKTPKLKAQYSVTVGGYELTKIPLLSLFVQIFIVIKLRKKFLYPKKATIKVPMAVKNALAQAIKETILFQRQNEKKNKFD